MDPANRNYVAGNPLEDSIREYYRAVDREVGELIALLPSDCAVMVVSDHGAKSMEGGVCVNEWLIEHGYLRLKEYPNKPTPNRRRRNRLGQDPDLGRRRLLHAASL